MIASLSPFTLTTTCTHTHSYKQPGDEDFLTAALTKNPKAFIEADLGLLLVPPTDKSSYIGMCVYTCKGGRERMTEMGEVARTDAKSSRRKRYTHKPTT